MTEKPECMDGGSPAGRRVLLWNAAVSADYLDALRHAGFHVVAALHNDGIKTLPPEQSAYPDLFWFSINDLFHGCQKLSEFDHIHAPSCWIDDTTYRAYALCAQRMGVHPCSNVRETISGGIVAASDLEDWARVHLNHALRLLEAVSVDEIWFGMPPHLGVDNMLALAAARTGRPSLLIEQIRFAPKFSCRRIDGVQHELVKGLSWMPWTTGTRQPDLSYMHENVGRPWYRGIGERVGFMLRNLGGADWPTISTRAYQGARKRRLWWLMYLLELLDSRTRVWAEARFRLRHRFDKASRHRPRIGEFHALGSFVYFPLHLEPEANTHASGGRYRNQLDAIVDLHRVLPEGWTIALKENPKQTWLHRGPPFVERLKELPHVHFVDDAMPSHELIDRAVLVATITGTAGYEALLAGKPCLYFGEPWYGDLLGATRFDPALDLVKLSTLRVPREALDEAVNALLSGLADGLAIPRLAGTFEASCDIAELYMQMARSMALISARLRAVELDDAKLSHDVGTLGIE